MERLVREIYRLFVIVRLWNHPVEELSNKTNGVEVDVETESRQVYSTLGLGLAETFSIFLIS